jgi:hypothetical protein
MKRFFCVLVFVALMLSLSVITFADGNLKIYGDFMIGGRYNYYFFGNGYDSNDSGSNSASFVFIGGQYTVDKLKIAGEMSIGRIGSSSNNSMYEIKGGYCFLESEEAKLYVTGNYFTDDATTAEYKYTSFMVGADGTFLVTDAVTLEGSFGFGLLNNFIDYSGLPYTQPGNLGIYNYKVKLNFIISDNIAISAGYRGLKEFRNYSLGRYSTEDISGFTLGALFKI